MNKATLIEVIKTTLRRRGEGHDLADPTRIITQFWDTDGKLLAEVDPCADLLDDEIKSVLQECYNIISEINNNGPVGVEQVAILAPTIRGLLWKLGAGV